MKKKMFICALVLAVCFTACARAQNYDSEDDFHVTPVDGGKSAMITSYVGNKQTISIPPRIQGLPVTAIGEGAFTRQNRGGDYIGKEIIRVTIPNSVTAIGNHAFAGNPLICITIPSSVTSIVEWAFYDWSSRQTINIQGHANRQSADAAWGAVWRGDCNATINYGR